MILSKDLRTILDVGIALTGEENYNHLLEKILIESMNITRCDAGTLYVYTQEGLKFMIMETRSLGISKGRDGEEIDLPPVPLREENVCAYAAIRQKVINIEDVYCSDEFDFKGPKNYDRMTGYRSKSMLVIPLKNHANETLGVIQLMNALDENNQIIPFEQNYEYIIFSLASQAAITLDNMNHLKEMKALLYSMVSAFTTAIDARTPYNANHTKNVAKYTEGLINFINEEWEAGNTGLHYSQKEKEEIVMAAYLHDIGKLITPLEVMNKATRLGGRLPYIINRFNLIRCYYLIDYLQGSITKDKFEEEDHYLQDSIAFIEKADTVSYLDDTMLKAIEYLGSKRYIRGDGSPFPYLFPEEKEKLSIRKGTLTAGERKIMEDHVVFTSTILNQIHFSKEFQDVPRLAGTHHELLDGSGYPNHLTGEQLPFDGKIITVLDIFDSLISADRPYKKPMPLNKALSILSEMAEEGKLDGALVEMLKRCIDRYGLEKMQQGEIVL